MFYIVIIVLLYKPTEINEPRNNLRETDAPRSQSHTSFVNYNVREFKADRFQQKLTPQFLYLAPFSFKPSLCNMTLFLEAGKIEAHPLLFLAPPSIIYNTGL